MSRQRRTSIGALLIRLIFVAGLLGASVFFILWSQLAPQGRYWLSLMTAATLAAASAAFLLLAIYLWRQRTRAWQRAMDDRNAPHAGTLAPVSRSVRALTPAQLEQFTARLFRKLNYRVLHTGQTGDHGVDVRLVNPAGQVELVQCKQWNKPVGEPEVRDLAGAMLHEKAVRGIIVAPGGFSDAARRWAQGKSIVLADEREIGRMVQRAYGH